MNLNKLGRSRMQFKNAYSNLNALFSYYISARSRLPMGNNLGNYRQGQSVKQQAISCHRPEDP